MASRSAGAVCATAKLGSLRLHDLRHTAACQAVMAGENLPLVGKLLGLKRHRTTAGYAHLADGHLVEVAVRVGSLVAEAMQSGMTDSTNRGLLTRLTALNGKAHAQLPKAIYNRQRSQPAEHQQMTNAKVITLIISLAAILSTQPASANDTDILIEGLLAQIYTAEIERYVLNPCGHELAKLESKRQIDLLIEQLGGIELPTALSELLENGLAIDLESFRSIFIVHNQDWTLNLAKDLMRRNFPFSFEERLRIYTDKATECIEANSN